MNEDELIKKTLETSKTIAMVGVSSIKKEVSTNIRRRPSTIVMKYMQEFGYRVIPVNPKAAGQTIYGETVVSKLEDIKSDVNVKELVDNFDNVSSLHNISNLKLYRNIKNKNNISTIMNLDVKINNE